MSNFLPLSDAPLLIRDESGSYLPASSNQILNLARKIIDAKMQRGIEFSSSETAKEYMRAKLAGFDRVRGKPRPSGRGRIARTP